MTPLVNGFSKTLQGCKTCGKTSTILKEGVKLKFNIMVQVEADDALTAAQNFRDGKVISANPVQERPAVAQPVPTVRGNSPVIQRSGDIPVGATIMPQVTPQQSQQ